MFTSWKSNFYKNYWYMARLYGGKETWEFLFSCSVNIPNDPEENIKWYVQPKLCLLDGWLSMNTCETFPY